MVGFFGKTDAIERNSSGVYITRIEIISRLSTELAMRNYWQAGYLRAAQDNGREREAEICKRRAMRSEYRAHAIMDFLSITCDVNCDFEIDFDTPRTPEGYHPITALHIQWDDECAETAEINA